MKIVMFRHLKMAAGYYVVNILQFITRFSYQNFLLVWRYTQNGNVGSGHVTRMDFLVIV